MTPKPLEELVGREVSSIEFVRDYVQIRFDGPYLSVYTLPTVRTSNGELFRSNTRCYADALVMAVGRVVTKVEDDGLAIRITCEEGPVIEISLDDQSRRTDEAATFMSDHNIIHSW